MRSIAPRQYAALAVFVANAVLAFSLVEYNVFYPIPAAALLIWYVVHLWQQPSPEREKETGRAE